MTKDTTLLKAAGKCHAFLTSMKKNKSRLDSLVMSPLEVELEKEKNKGAKDD